MKMEFTVQEREILEAVFPKVQGKIEVVKEATWFEKDVGLSPADKENNDIIKEIEVTDNIKPIIVATLQMMDDKGLITKEVLTLWDKFITKD